MSRADTSRRAEAGVVPGPSPDGRLRGRAVGSRHVGRTVLLCIPSGTAAANLLRTNVFPRLRDAPDVRRVVIVSPLSREAYFREEHGHEKVRFEELAPHEPGWIERRFIRVLQEKYVKTMPTESMRMRIARERLLEIREVRYGDRGGLREPSTRARRATMSVIKRLPVSLPALFKASDALTLGDRYRELFRREKPDLLVTPTTGIYLAEGPIMARADREAVPILAVDLSWDHFDMKTAPLRRVAGLSAWNEIMKREAIELHGYRPDAVHVSGVPQFDIYADQSIYAPREQFLRSIGADPAKKLVTLTTIPPVLYDYHELVVEELLGAIRQNALGRPAQVLVRVHPRDHLAKYDKFKGEPNVIVEKPFRQSIVAEGSSVDPSRADRAHLANTLKHSDVLLNVQSTITIEAAILDTPIVNLGFDGHDERPFLDSARRYYQYTHYKPLVDIGAVRVASSPAEMVALAREYLNHPERDREARRKAVEILCYKFDGRSADRVAELVLRFLARVR